jgi:hypothetical protein
MNNQLKRVDPDTGSAIARHIAPGSHALNARLPESPRTRGAATHDDPKRGMTVHWPHDPAGLPAQQGWSGPASEPASEPASGLVGRVSDFEDAAPHAVALLCRVWGKPEAAKAFEALFLAADGRMRRWSPDAWAELVLMRDLHQSVYPCPAPDAAMASGAATRPDPACLPELEVRYRHVIDRLLRCWGNVEAFAAVYHDLIFDSRGDRAGWPAGAWSDLVLLQEIHDEAYGRLPTGIEP